MAGADRGPDGGERGGTGRALHHALVLAVPVLVCLVAVHDLHHVAVKAKPPAALRLGAGLAALGLGTAAFASCATMWAAGRWRTTALAPLRLAFVVFALATGVQLVLFQPYLYDTWARVFVPAAAVAAGLLPFAVWRCERPLGRGLRVLDFALFNACLLPFLLEAGLRVAPHVSRAPLFDFDDLSARDRVDRNRWVPGSLRFGFPLNRDANYDTERALGPREGPLVVTVGDSFSQGVVPYRFHYTTVAERALADDVPGVEVYNLGVGAIGPPEYELLLREQGLALDPDLVVVALFLGNDSEIHVKAHGRGAALAPFFNRRSLRTTLVAKRLQALRTESEVLAARRDDIEFSNQLYGTDAELFEAFPWLEDPTLEEPTFSEATFLRIEKLRLLECCHLDKSDFGPMFAALESLVEAVGDVRLAFLLIPDEFQVEDALWEQLRQVPPAVPDSRLDRDLIQRAVAQWLDERGLPHLDLLPVLRAVEPLPDGRRHLYKLRDTHFNVRGNAEAGRAFARFLEELLRDGGGAGGGG